ncbi:hypothetical protein DFH08DRAFT_801792 [Mycena albidolilacea]|uniref:Uncharacterized protein n=1 Tax=Mycena albidolilacea TaxID=1033008 RepID=A0AAD7EZR3_9AGAR|nr:hypothetical protein DFH08DRAFT_801791 [Mycena albidolilacea]KAJ7357913.1 hypothetical protein DFH08DRAFT_801792 [Mycena albidolilacea]
MASNGRGTVHFTARVDWVKSLSIELVNPKFFLRKPSPYTYLSGFNLPFRRLASRDTLRLCSPELNQQVSQRRKTQPEVNIEIRGDENFVHIYGVHSTSAASDCSDHDHPAIATCLTRAHCHHLIQLHAPHVCTDLRASPTRSAPLAAGIQSCKGMRTHTVQYTAESRWMSGSNPQRVCVRHARRAFAAADGLFGTHKQCGSPAYQRACVLCAAAFVVSDELVGRAARRGPRNGNGAAEYQSPISIFGCKCMPRDFSGECGAGAVHDSWHLGKD